MRPDFLRPKELGVLEIRSNVIESFESTDSRVMLSPT